MKVIDNPETLAEHIVNALLEDLSDRSGFDFDFEPDVLAELVETHIAIVTREYLAWTNRHAPKSSTGRSKVELTLEQCLELIIHAVKIDNPEGALVLAEDMLAQLKKE